MSGGFEIAIDKGVDVVRPAKPSWIPGIADVEAGRYQTFTDGSALRNHLAAVVNRLIKESPAGNS